MRRRTILAGVGTAAGAALSGCVDDAFGEPVTEEFAREYDVSGETVVSISNRNGDVTVREADGNRLRVSGEKRAGSQGGLDSIAVEVLEGDRFVVDVRFSTGSDFSNRSVTLHVAVPSGVAVDRVETANGTVTVEGVRGDVRAVTNNGSVEVSDVSGVVQCRTGNGNVRVRNATGLAGARTDSGNVDVDLLSARDDVTCRSTNGDVTVRVGPNVALGFRLSTDNGTVSVEDLPYTATTERRGYLVGRLRGEERPVVFAETSNGNVTLRPA